MYIYVYIEVYICPHIFARQKCVIDKKKPLFKKRGFLFVV